jgi:hydroxyethylthiazole kinase-like uncharacterized protein yjeF
MKILDANAMREVDRAAIEEIGVPSLVLMENAAIGLVDALSTSYPEATSVAIFCGPGNNGGDGLALARHLAVRGYHVETSLFGTARGLSADAETQLAICRKLGLAIHEFQDEESARQAVNAGAGLDLAVDALFGTGLTRSLEGLFAEVVAAFNLLQVPRIAVDLPSGLNGSSAEIIGPHVFADLTVTFAAPKVPHVLQPAASAVGEVVIADLGIPQQLIEEAAGDLYLLTREELADTLGIRPVASHKGDYGHCVLLSGSIGKAGAAILAARAAVRGGAGLVTVATPEMLVQTVDLGSLESMTLPVEVDEDRGLAETTLEQLLEFSRDKQVLAIGPGLGTERSTTQVVQGLVNRCETPIVLDADGLNAFSGALDKIGEGAGPRVLTPHPGELARLLGSTAAEVQEDRVANAREAAARSRSVVVLKGAQSLVAAPDGAVFVNPTGNPGMATGGSGDVLTGLIAAFIAQGHDPLIAACLGVYVHGAAGDLEAEEVGEVSLAAGDILNSIPHALQQLR